MKRHAFDPTAFILGLAFAAFGLFFLIGERTAADIGWKWMWPFPFILLGLLFVISAGRRMLGDREERATHSRAGDDNGRAPRSGLTQDLNRGGGLG